MAILKPGTIMTTTTRLQHLRKVIDRADIAYYNTGTPSMTDEQYDALKDELIALAPGDERNARFGPPELPKMLQKIKHGCFMGSLKKSDTEEELRAWYHNMLGALPPESYDRRAKIVVALKADGGSVALYYKEGKLHKAVTRGGDDGIGEDITANAIHMAGVPTELLVPSNIAIRGEVVMTVDNWLTIDPNKESNPRNVGNGTMRRLDHTSSDLLSFAAFDAEGMVSGFPDEVITEADKLQMIKGLGFNVIEHVLVKDISEAIEWYKGVAARRDKLPFWIDGVVFKMNDLALQRELGIKDNRPKAQTVLKFEAEGAETILREVVLSMGHTGAVIPTGKVDPVRIGGTTVSSVLLNNFQLIADMDLAIGDKVRIIKAKDIIPQIVEVLERPESRIPVKEPTKCPVCGHATGRRTLSGKAAKGEGAMTECKNAGCQARANARIKTWITKLDILGIGDELLESLIASGDVKTPADLYRTASEPVRMAFFPGTKVGAGKLGAKRAKSIIDQINSKKEMPIYTFMGSLGIPHLGRRRVELIYEAVPGEFATIDDWLNTDKLKKFAAQASIPNIVDEITAGIIAFGDEIADLRQFITIVNPELKVKNAAPVSGVFSGMTFCFTGKIEKTDAAGKRYTRERMQQLASENGGSTMDDVKTGCTHLVQADPNSVSSKTQKAVKMGIKIMSEADFFKALNL